MRSRGLVDTTSALKSTLRYNFENEAESVLVEDKARAFATD